MKSPFSTSLHKFKMETIWLHSEFMEMSAKPDERYAQLACEMVVIRLHDAWTRFCREVVVLSALGNITTIGGTTLTPVPGITDRSSFFPVLRKKYPYRLSFEPKWGTAIQCIDAAARLSLGNRSTIAAAIGAVNSPAESIRKVRNYYAHRRRQTAQQAGSTGLFHRPLHPTVYDLTAYRSGGSMVIESWVADLLLIATQTIQ